KLAGPYIVVTEEGIGTLWKRVAAALDLGAVQVRQELVAKAGHFLHDETHFIGHRDLPRWGTYAAFNAIKFISSSSNLHSPWQGTGCLVRTSMIAPPFRGLGMTGQTAPGISEYGGKG